MSALIEFTSPGYDVRTVTKGPGSTVQAHHVPEARFTVRADMIIAVEEAAESDDYTIVRASIEKWEVTESYDEAMTLWREGLAHAARVAGTKGAQLTLDGGL